MKCEHCGAVLTPQALECGFCRAPTPAGLRAREQAEHEQRARAQWASASEQQERFAAQARLQSTSSQSLWWSIGGFFICCMPVAVVGLIQGLRARGLARSIGAPLPGRALAGLILSGIGSASSIALFTAAMIGSSQDKEAAETRIKVLEAQTQIPAQAASMTQPTACALAEAYALKSGYDDAEGQNLARFDCLGKLTATSDSAALDAFRFAKNKKNYEVNVCFKRGARWYVTSLQEQACGAVPPAASK